MRRSILRRFAIIALVSLAVASASSFALSYAYGRREALKAGAEATEAAAEVVRRYFDAGDSRALTSLPAPGSESYVELHGVMEWLCDLYGLEYLSLYSADEARTVRTYYLAVSSDEEEDRLVHDELGYGATSDSPFSEDELAAFAGREPDDTPYHLDNRFGSTYAWFYPLVVAGRDDLCVICAEVNVGAMTAAANHNALSFAIPMGVILVLVIGMELYLLNHGVVGPLRVVSARMRNFVADQRRKEAPLDLGRSDEIGEIADSFNQMSRNIEQYVGQIEDMTEERVAASTELQVARRIQLGLVPQACEESGPGFEAFAFIRAAREVGGDFYDLFAREDGRVCLVVADVSGKGVSAALFMAMTRTLLREKLAQGIPPAQALNQANEQILANNPELMFVTAFVGVYDPASGELRFANAGHTRPYVLGRGYLTPQTGVALGLFEDAGIVEEAVALAPGEGIVLYTDGVTEAVGPEHAFYGEERLAVAAGGGLDVQAADGELGAQESGGGQIAGSADDGLGALEACGVVDEHAAYDGLGAQAAVESVVASVDAFVAGNEQFDDLTLLCLVARPHAEWHWTVAPQLSSFATLRQGILEVCGNNAATRQAILALDEAFSNVVNYAGASLVEVWATREGERLQLQIVDDGVAFDPLGHDDSGRDFEDFENGGMGIMLIKQVSCDLSYERDGTRNVLTMTFDL